MSVNEPGSFHVVMFDFCDDHGLDLVEKRMNGLVVRLQTQKKSTPLARSVAFWSRGLEQVLLSGRPVTENRYYRPLLSVRADQEIEVH